MTILLVITFRAFLKLTNRIHSMLDLIFKNVGRDSLSYHHWWQAFTPSQTRTHSALLDSFGVMWAWWRSGYIASRTPCCESLLLWLKATVKYQLTLTITYYSQYDNHDNQWDWSWKGATVTQVMTFWWPFWPLDQWSFLSPNPYLSYWLPVTPHCHFISE